VAENAARGIRTGSSSLIQENTVSANGSIGVETISSTVVGNTINANTGFGLVGSGTTGYSGNTLAGNNGAGAEAFDVVPQHPNACEDACP
jgi:hypothetical protein